MIQVKRAIFTVLFLGLVYELPRNAYLHWCVFSATKQVVQEDSDIITEIQISSARQLTAADYENSGYGSLFCVVQYVAKFTEAEIPQKMRRI